MSDYPKTQLPLTRCVRGYQDEPGAPSTLPIACQLHCPIVRGENVPEIWLNAQDCADRLGYRSANTFTGAWRRGRIFRNVLRQQGRHHRATSFPLCGLSAYKQWLIATAAGVGSIPALAQARREAESRAKQQALVRAQEAFERIVKTETEKGRSSTRRIVEYLLQHREGLSDADIARIVSVTRQRVWAIKHGVDR
jgi:hypothetical protein